MHLQNLKLLNPMAEEMLLQEHTLFVLQKPLHQVIYVITKFEAATPKDQEGRCIYNK